MERTVGLGLHTFGDITVGADGSLLSHAQVIRHVVEQAVLADGAGVDFFGVGEHHRADFAVSSPEVVLAVVAGRTRRIRLGSAVTIISTDDPVRVYQRFSTLYAASSGRAEVMLGRGWFTESFPLFGYQLSQYEALFEEKLRLFAQLTRPGVARPDLAAKRVFPPLEEALKTWIAVGSTPESVLRAARYGCSLMIAAIGGEARRFKPFVELYHRALDKLGNPVREVGVHSGGHVAATDAQAHEEFWPAYQEYRDRIGAERGWPPISRAQFDAEVSRGCLYVGSPETVARKIAATVQALDLSRFDLRYSMGRLSHGLLMRSIELYGTKVIPLVRDMLS